MKTLSIVELEEIVRSWLYYAKKELKRRADIKPTYTEE